MKGKFIKIKIQKKEILWSMAIGLLVLFLSYEAMNVYWPWTGGEKMKLQICEWIRQSLLQKNFGDEMSDSIMMVDVHYDKVFTLEYNEALPKGNVAVTDHQKLLMLLKKLKQYDNYKYIMLDLYIEKSVPQKADEELVNLIKSMNRIVIPMPLEGQDNIDIRLISHAAMARYGSTIWENDFVKYPYYSDGMKSIPLKMYEDMTGRTIDNYSLFAWDKGLARRNVMLTYEFRESKYPYLLGLGILGDSLAGQKTLGILDKPEKFKDKYILIGDFEDDRHETFIGEMSGTAINFNAFVSLLHGYHRLGVLLITILFVFFSLLAYLTLIRNRLIFAGFWGYGTYLLVFCIIIYLLCNEVYEILILSVFYAGIKKCVENNWYKSIFRAMKKKIIITMIMLFCGYISPNVNAKQYRILELINCSSIKIGKKVLGEQAVFDDRETVYWKSSIEAMRVISSSGEKRVFAEQGFVKYKATSLADFLTKEKGLASRGDSNDDVYYRHRDFYLIDSLHFKVKEELDTTLVTEAVWVCEDRQVITKIQRSEDGNYYIITPEIFGDQSPRNILLYIRERDEEYDYIDNIYSAIPIIYIPIIKQE